MKYSVSYQKSAGGQSVGYSVQPLTSRSRASADRNATETQPHSKFSLRTYAKGSIPQEPFKEAFNHKKDRSGYHQHSCVVKHRRFTPTYAPQATPSQAISRASRSHFAAKTKEAQVQQEEGTSSNNEEIMPWADSFCGSRSSALLRQLHSLRFDYMRLRQLHDAMSHDQANPECACV